MNRNQLFTNVPDSKIQISRKRSLLPIPSVLRAKSQISISSVKESTQDTIIPDHLKDPSEAPHDQIKFLNLPINIKPDPVCAVKPSKANPLLQCIAAEVYPNARGELASRKKSTSCLNLQPQKKLAEPSKKSVSGSITSRSLMSTMPNSLNSKAGVNVFHKPGTIPLYLNRAKANSLQTQLIKRQKDFDDQKKAFSEMQGKLIEKYEDLVLYRAKVKNSVVKEMVLDKMECMSKGVKITDNCDTFQTNAVNDPEHYQHLEYEHLERAYGNLLRFEAEMQKMSKTNWEASQIILDIRSTNNIKYVRSHNFYYTDL